VAGLVRGASSKNIGVKSLHGLKPMREEMRGIPTIVVWEHNDGAGREREPRVAAATQAGFLGRADRRHLEARCPRREKAGERLVLVLVDDDHLEVFEGLRGETVEQRIQRFGASARRDDQRDEHVRPSMWW
jgi:hypothetical protein